MIDIARAKLPGGEVGEYQIGRGMSALMLAALDVSVAEFVDIVGNAITDEEVAKRLGLGAIISLEELGARPRRLTVEEVPADLRSEFRQMYGADLPLDRLLFDVLDADDAKNFLNRKARSSEAGLRSFCRVPIKK